MYTGMGVFVCVAMVFQVIECLREADIEFNAFVAPAAVAAAHHATRSDCK